MTSYKTDNINLGSGDISINLRRLMGTDFLDDSDFVREFKKWLQSKTKEIE